jgi:hypothetical protein
MVSIPAVRGMYPVTAVGSPLNDADTMSVDTVPVAVAVCAAEHAADAIALVANALAPLAIVIATSARKLTVLGSDVPVLYRNPVTGAAGNFI